jgi:NAD(P)-dependent dehydrogenase (short-subunit alcohol dehydrogenase family)
MMSLKGRTVMITGATDGLGKLVAHNAAKKWCIIDSAWQE